jgi:pimeloyl-ACP methyl ester carboxylesterase
MAEEARRALPNASAHHFERVGHMVAQVQPDLAIEALRRFWAELAS